MKNPLAIIFYVASGFFMIAAGHALLDPSMTIDRDLKDAAGFLGISLVMFYLARTSK